MIHYSFTIKTDENWLRSKHLIVTVDKDFELLSDFINITYPVQYPTFLQHVYYESRFSNGDYNSINFYREISDEEIIEGLDFPKGYIKIKSYNADILITEECFWQILYAYATKLLEIFENDSKTQIEYQKYLEGEKKAIPQDENIRNSQWYKEAYTFRDTLNYTLHSIWSEAMKDGIKKIEDKMRDFESGKIKLLD